MKTMPGTFRPFLSVCTLVLLSACASTQPVSLMPTPVLYEDGSIEPFSHIAGPLRTPETRVFYATNRAHRAHDPERPYGNGVDDELHLGVATVRIGDQSVDWDDVVEISLSNPIDSEIPITLEDVVHWESLVHRASDDVVDWDEQSHRRFIEEVNEELAHHIDQEIMVYVHGTKFNFENAVAMAGEIEHFAGRDFVGVSFAWPSHQNILHYLFGVDVRRAQHSSEALRDLLRLLASETMAHRINVLAWSAGGRVTSKALHELRQAESGLTPDELRSRYRLGSVVLAAADVEVDDFLDRLPSISAISEEVVVTVTDDDVALNAARKYMRGDDRIGTLEAEARELAFIEEHHLDNVEIIDVSHGQDARGFDITGHHYWYRHPWNASDIILLMRTDLRPAARGLSPAGTPGLWYLSPDYPERVRRSAAAVLQEDWNRPLPPEG